MDKEITIETLTQTTVKLTGRDILMMCEKLGILKEKQCTEVLFTVPSGADYSGMTLNLLVDKNLTFSVVTKIYDKSNAKD